MDELMASEMYHVNEGDDEEALLEKRALLEVRLSETIAIVVILCPNDSYQYKLCKCL